MKIFIGIFLLLISPFLWAEIQVPEDCVNHSFPCLIRADEKNFKFVEANLEIQLTKKSIVKISQEANKHINFELLAGRIEIQEKKPSDQTSSINSVLIDGPHIMASRDHDMVSVFNLSNFTLAEYSIQFQNDNFPERVSSNFLSKSELVEFTKYYFSQVKGFKAFLASIEKDWSAEFKKQNDTQTKALLRSIASEEKEADEKLRKKQREEAELKKVKSEFFSRTFNR